jgi:hypothetical protein
LSLIIAPTPTVRQVLDGIFQLVIANAPGSAVAPAQRSAVALGCEDLLERFVEGRIRAAIAKHVASEAELFDARVLRVIETEFTVEAKPEGAT